MNSLTTFKATHRQQVEANLQASLPHSIGSSLTKKLNSDYMIVGYDLCDDVSQADLREGIALIDASLAPCPASYLAQLLSQLFVTCARRKEDEQLQLDLVIEVYGSRLMDYPADIVEEVLLKWPDENKWFPTWHELKSEIDWRNKRARLKETLEKKLNDAA
jgi:hypothetical protein